MKRRRRNEQNENEEAVELDEVLEPYEEELQWADENGYADRNNEQDDSSDYQNSYEDFYGDEYSEEHELADSEGRFRIAIGVFDLISIIVGIVVILVLVSMLITLFNWLKNDILHSALLLQNGLL